MSRAGIPDGVHMRIAIAQPPGALRGEICNEKLHKSFFCTRRCFGSHRRHPLRCATFAVKCCLPDRLIQPRLAEHRTRVKQPHTLARRPGAGVSRSVAEPCVVFQGSFFASHAPFESGEGFLH
eukprot:365968-Chlamydomonas_euryale.AAC.2